MYNAKVRNNLHVNDRVIETSERIKIMERDEKINKQPFVPVILGADIGVYSIARAFNEAYKVKSVTVSRQVINPVKHSSIVQTVLHQNMDDSDSLLAKLEEVSKTYQDLPKILVSSSDGYVNKIVSLKNQLDEQWVVPYTSPEKLEKVTNKAQFYQLCEELELDYPKFLSFKEQTTENLNLPFDFPVVVKPAVSTTYKEVSFTGKKKAFIIKSREEFDRVITTIREANYRDELIIQEFIPGNDTYMHILTLYTAQDGETKFASFGQTLLEDHTPGGIGNPVAIRTLRNDEVIAQAKKLVEHVGWTGFSNFDLKYDERDGKYKFFELNPRLGRSNYYVTAEGHNPIEYYVQDFLEEKKLNFTIAENEALYSLVPKRLLLKYTVQPHLKEKVKALYKKGKAKNPMNYFPVEKNPKRWFYVLLSTVNFYRKFKKYPPL